MRLFWFDHKTKIIKNFREINLEYIKRIHEIFTTKEMKKRASHHTLEKREVHSHQKNFVKSTI